VREISCTSSSPHHATSSSTTTHITHVTSHITRAGRTSTHNHHDIVDNRKLVVSDL
jgi:hypothetical protein